MNELVTCSLFLIILICCLQMVQAAITFSSLTRDGNLPLASPKPAAWFFFCSCFFKSFFEAGIEMRCDELVLKIYKISVFRV